jgi:quercetin dioxygenase-like cupin family protein
MKKLRIEDMKLGWFVGNFEPTAFKSEDFEVCYRVHPKGDVCMRHTHKIGTEINLLVRGRMKICDEELTSGDIFIIYPGEISDPVFFEDCEIICVKSPSVPGDKYEV